ncbi:MAG: ATP-binding cassette domain-containing protein [Elainellaceae cyanobacterium]
MAHVTLDHVYKQFSQQQRQAEATAPVAASALPLTPRATDTSATDTSATDTRAVDTMESPSQPGQNDQDDSSHRTVSVLRDITLTVESGEFLALVGPSGCGKSTLLRLIAGLETLTAGDIWVGDRKVNHLPPKQRNVAMVFQSYALYPHMSVYDNLAFGLRRMGDAKLSSSRQWQQVAERLSRALPPRWRYATDREADVEQRVRQVAQMLQIDPLLSRLPRQLSGGQKQRVALGRAIARSPEVFLMDEPLSNLDAKLRTETRGQISDLQRQLGTTTIYVTHDQTEAMTMGNRIAVMNQGQIQQVAAPLTLYHQPANRFVAQFIGTLPMNFLPVQVHAPLLVVHPALRLTLPERWQSALRRYDGATIWLGIRPEHLSLAPPAPKNLCLQVERVETLGSDTQVMGHLAEAGQQSLQARLAPTHMAAAGDTIWLSLNPAHIHLFDPDTTAALRPDGPQPFLP